MKRLNIIVCILISVLGLYGQPPDYVYEGGNGGGFASDNELISGVYFYEGNIGSGYASTEESSQNLYLYKGGNGQGFISNFQSDNEVLFYRGGNGDGYVSAKGTGTNLFVYEGGSGGGYDSKSESHTGTTFYEGDDGDGYDIKTWCRPFVWTGTIGTGWSVADNWNFSVVPDITRPVIIPSGAPNYPNVNAGILAIGENPNLGAFECKSILIENGGFLITRINNFVENYGDIIIEGTMQVKNSAANALQNLENGTIRITPTGTLFFKEE